MSIMKTQSDRLRDAAVLQAQSIEYKWHWLIGSVVILSAIAIAEYLSSDSEISMAYSLLVLFSGILSKQFLAVLWPNACIWLAKKLVWAMDFPEQTR